MTDLPASWQTDPTGRHDHRYWDGTAWTENVADAGIAAIDPYEPTASAEAAVAPEPEPAPEPTPEPTPEAEPEPTTAAPSAIGWGSPQPTATPTDAPTTVTASGWGAPAEAEAPAEPEPTAVTPAASGWASTPTAIGPSVGGDAPTEINPPVFAPTGPSTFADDPAPLPPFDPTPPTADAGDGGSGGGGGGARRNLMIGVAVLVVVGIVAFLAISGDDDDASSNAVADRIVASLKDSQPEIAKKDASCMADYIVDEVGADRLKGVDWDADATPPGDLGRDITDAYAKAVSKCKVDLSDSTGGGDTATTDLGSTDSNTGGLGDVGDVDAFKDLLTKQYESTLGLSHEKAQCLADAMGKAIKEGKLDQQDAFGDFFDYLDSCHISLSELSGTPSG